MLGAIIGSAAVAWIVSARKWFTGPIRQVYSTGTEAVDFGNSDDKDEGAHAKAQVVPASEEVE